MTKATKSTTGFLIQDAVVCLTLCAVMVLALGVTNSFAAVNNSVGDALCTVPTSVIGGNLGRAIASIGILVIGVGATLGRVTWTQAVIVGTGIAVMFGAITLAGSLAGGYGVSCPTS